MNGLICLECWPNICLCFGWVAEGVVVVWVLVEYDDLLSPLVPHLDLLSPSPHAHVLALFDHHTPVWV